MSLWLACRASTSSTCSYVTLCTTPCKPHSLISSEEGGLPTDVPGHSILYLFSDGYVQILEARGLAGRVRARHCWNFPPNHWLLVCFIWKFTHLWWETTPTKAETWKSAFKPSEGNSKVNSQPGLLVYNLQFLKLKKWRSMYRTYSNKTHDRQLSASRH